MNASLKTRIENWYLRWRYLLFKKFLNKIDFSNRNLLFSDNFQSLDNWSVKNQFYNEHPIWFSSDAVHITNNGVIIDCYPDKRTHTSWQGTRDALYTSGMITSEHNVLYSGGVWVVTAKPCDSWCAIWLLKKDRIEPPYTTPTIIPEIDIMEILFNYHYAVKHTVHYGYSNTEYKTKWVGTKSLLKPDGKFHEFAVECISNGYKFYIDGILTGKFLSNDPEFVSDCPNYILLNNATQFYTENTTNFVIKSVKFYE